MEEQKKTYTAPEAQKVEFDFREQVVASDEEPSCDGHQVWGSDYQVGRCWPLYTSG